jgi:hypothetical protein
MRCSFSKVIKAHQIVPMGFLHDVILAKNLQKIWCETWLEVVNSYFCTPKQIKG